MVARSQRLALVVGVLALIPVLAATGLSLPLPAAVERIAAALVPWAEAATLADQPVERSAVGSIVLTSAERSNGLAAPLSADVVTQDRPNPKKVRGIAHKPTAAAPTSPAPTAGAASRDRGRAERQQRTARPSNSTLNLSSSEPPSSDAAGQRSDNTPQPKHDAGVQPHPSVKPEPKTSAGAQQASDPPPTHTPTPQNPVQQAVEQTVETVATTTQTVATTTQTVATTTQTVVSKTVPVLAPVLGLVANPGGVTGGGLPSGSGSNSGSGNSGSGNSGSGNSGSGNSGSGNSGSGNSGSGSSGSGSSGSGP